MNHEETLSRLAGIVDRVTFHNTENGWSVLKISPYNEPHRLVTVVIHQAKVFAGCSMEFWGEWSIHPKHGEQFKALRAIETKPASTAAIEKYLGSGLIKGVGPKIASRIVKHFRDKTLQVFEDSIDDLLNVPGIANKKLVDIKDSWQEHKAIRDVMIFLQGYGISTLFAVKIFKAYGKNAVSIVSKNPYQLAHDIYGIGFFSADKIALSMGFQEYSSERILAGIKHVLASSREQGHCYLTEEQILNGTADLLANSKKNPHENQSANQSANPDKTPNESQIKEKIALHRDALVQANEVKKRCLVSDTNQEISAYYSNSLYYDEQYVATKIKNWIGDRILVDLHRVENWATTYCAKHSINLSEEQKNSVIGITEKSFCILTGGPGCGKTTTTRVLVKLLVAMKKQVVLAAPTGRAAQRMSEVIGIEAKTIHRLLEWLPKIGRFKKCEDDPLVLDFLVIDECSMLDISLAAALLKAIPKTAQVLFIGDPDQLPSVGAGNVLYDILQTSRVPSFRLTKVFRQAEESMIIRFAHQINKGEVPKISSPFYNPALWEEKAGCLFIDAEEANQEQLRFLQKAKYAIKRAVESGEEQLIQSDNSFSAIMTHDNENDSIKIENLLVQEFKTKSEINAPTFIIPEKFKHVDFDQIHKAKGAVEEIKAIMKSVHPWSALHSGKTALDMILHLYTKTIQKHFGTATEIQILSPQVRGTLGTANLNSCIQSSLNPERSGIKHLKIGDRIYREGDRVIQTKNNYDLGVFNGDIGKISHINLENLTCEVIYNKQEPVLYAREDLNEVSLAYAITIHKSQGSEFDAVIIPVANQHFKMLYRNLIYTGLTRAKKLCIFIGNRKALALAVQQIDNRKRQTALTALLELG